MSELTKLLEDRRLTRELLALGVKVQKQYERELAEINQKIDKLREVVE